jgi:hypothetical protein
MEDNAVQSIRQRTRHPLLMLCSLGFLEEGSDSRILMRTFLHLPMFRRGRPSHQRQLQRKRLQSLTPFA